MCPLHRPPEPRSGPTRSNWPIVLLLPAVAALLVPGTPATGAGTWAPTEPLADGRFAHTSTTLEDGRVLVVGGQASATPGSPLGSAELYDPVNERWAGAGQLRSPRSSHTATLLDDGRVLVAGGIGSKSQPVSSAELFDPVSGTWRVTKAAPGTARYEGVAVLLSGSACGQSCGKVLFAGGFGPKPIESVELYDPRADEWSATADLATPRGGPVGVMLNGPGCGANCGKVLVAGGYFFAGGHNDVAAGIAEIYDPASGTWAPTGGLAFPRVSSDAVSLADGKVLVAGGMGTGEERVAGSTFSQLFDPATGAWAPTKPMNHARVSGSWLTRLVDGTVLAIGGSAQAVPAELFDATDGTWRAIGPPLESTFLASSSLLHCGAGAGRVLTTGGTGPAKPVPAARLFEPASASPVPACTARLRPEPKSNVGAADQASSAARGEPGRRSNRRTAAAAAAAVGAFAGLAIAIAARRRRQGGTL